MTTTHEEQVLRHMEHVRESLAIKLPEESIFPVEEPEGWHPGGPTAYDIPAVWFLDTFGIQLPRETHQDRMTELYYFIVEEFGPDLHILLDQPERSPELKERLSPPVFDYLVAVAAPGGCPEDSFSELRYGRELPSWLWLEK